LSIEILVNVAPRETRASIVENGVLQEIYVERTSRRGIVSNLYKGRVSRVLLECRRLCRHRVGADGLPARCRYRQCAER